MKILVAEDDPACRFLLEQDLLSWGYEVVAAADGDQAWRILTDSHAPRLALLDWRMPGLDGPTLCRKIREELKEPYTYVILLTGQHRNQDLVAGMEAGADDYITKPFRHGELKVRLRAGRRIIELQNELLAARENLREKASHDSLTGVWNHEEILSILRRELARAERDGTRVGVIMADLDHFKEVNDTYGHLAGDSVIRLVARRMLSLVRPYDDIGRYGGEEFLVVLPECRLEYAAAFAERLRLSICRRPLDTAEGMIPLSISLGVAASDPEHTEGTDPLVRAADNALYRAKKLGRNRVEVSAQEDQFRANG
jgi:diguanylate cyclase (GGDEF)-like protein